MSWELTFCWALIVIKWATGMGTGSVDDVGAFGQGWRSPCCRRTSPPLLVRS